MKRTLRPLLLAVSLYGWAAAAGGVFLLAGCGGGGATPAGAPTVAAPSAPAAPAGRGGLEVLIKWPPMPAESSRLIPAAARSILVVVTTTDGRRLGEQFSTRPFTGEKQTPPTDTAFFPDLPAGPVLVLASAFPSDDGTGVPQATGSLTTTVVANQKTRTPPLTMGTTIVKVQIDVPGVTLTPGQSTQVSVSTLDAQNNLVLTAPGVLAWKIEGIAGVSVTPTGNPATVTAAADAQAGSGSLSVTETESGIAGAPIPVTVAVPAPGANPTIFVADSGNKRVVGMDDISGANFTVYSGFSSGSSGENPQDVDLDLQGRIYIASYPRAIVRVDDLNGTNKVEYRPDSPPGKVWVDAAGRIYWRDDLLRINRIDDISGANLVRFGGLTSGLFQAPAGIVTDSANRIYVIDTGKTRVSRFDDMTGANPRHYGSQGSGVGQFKFSFGVSARPISIDNADRIYIADTENRRVVRLDAAALDDPAAANWTVFDIPADPSGNVFRPLSVAVDEAASPRIYLSGYYYNGASLATIDYAILRLDDMAGGNLQRFGSRGGGSGQFESPVAIRVK